MHLNRENKVVARFTDGTMLKGTTLDFFPNKPFFHVLDAEGDTHEVPVERLKAVFFVKALDGTPRAERKGFFTRTLQGRKVMVEFADGEVAFGYTLSYSTRGLGFFMFPGDPESNNIKIFIVHRSTVRVKVHTLPTSYRTSQLSG